MGASSRGGEAFCGVTVSEGGERSGGTSLAETVGLEKSMLKKILHYSDVGVALLMVLVVVMMVIPLPTWLIDILLSTNITLGVVVLLVTFYVNGW